MSVFKNKSSVYQDDYVIKQRMEEDYQNYNYSNIAFQAEANLDLQYYAGDQYAANTLYAGLSSEDRKFVFNLIRRMVEMPAGYQIQHRKSTIAIPVENGDQETSDQLSKILSWVERTGNLQEVISEAFTFGTLVTGMNLIEIYMDYSDDPVSGDIRYDRIGHNAVMMDPYFKKMDLSDCSSIWKRSYVTKDQAKSLLPDYKKEIDGMAGSESRDGKFQFMPETYNFDVNKLLTYDEYYYMDTREQRVIIDKETGDKQEWIGEDDMLRFIMQRSPELETYKQTIPSVKQGIVLQDRLFYEGGCLVGLDSYPFTPFMGYYSPDLRDPKFRMQGMVRALRDPQYLFNRRQVISLDVLESRTTSGYMAVEGSVIDPESLYKTGQGQVIWRKKGSNPEDVQPIAPPDISPGMAKLTEDMSELIKTISGVSDEMLGQASDDIPGILSMMRQGAGQLLLQKLFNNSDTAQRLIGQKTVEIIQRNFTPGKVQRIIEEQPTEEFYNQNFGKYDIAIEEGFYTATQKQQSFAQALQLKQLGLDFPALDEFLLESSTIQNKSKLIEALQKQQEAQQQQQQQESQMAQQEQQATIEMAQARAKADEGLGRERDSRIPENYQLADRNKAEAEEKHEQAILNKAKTLSELQDIDLKKIEQIVKIAKTLKEDELQDDEIRRQKTHQDLSQRMAQLGNRMSQAAQPPASGL